jgi:hypothetical protein
MFRQIIAVATFIAFARKDSCGASAADQTFEDRPRFAAVAAARRPQRWSLGAKSYADERDHHSPLELHLSVPQGVGSAETR